MIPSVPKVLDILLLSASRCAVQWHLPLSRLLERGGTLAALRLRLAYTFKGDEHVLVVPLEGLRGHRIFALGPPLVVHSFVLGVETDGAFQPLCEAATLTPPPSAPIALD